MKKNTDFQGILAGLNLRHCFTIFIIIVAFIVGCAPPPIKTTILMPAANDEATKLKQVAVLPFDGRHGREFAMEVEGALASINIGDKQYFTLVDRVKLDNVLSEMKLSQSGLFQESTIAKIGQMVGAKGIYTGVVTESNSTDNPFTENRQRCAYQVTKKDNKGREYQTCGRYENYQVSCIQRNARFGFTPKLTDIETGRIVYSNNLFGSASSSGCSDSSKPVAGVPELINQAKQQALTSFRHEVAPHYATITIKIMDNEDGIKSDEAKEKFASGLKFAGKERFDRACELWGEARILSPNALSILYNLGVCAEITGNLEQALDLYKKSDRLTSKPDDRITEALKRVSDLIKKQDKLRGQN